MIKIYLSLTKPGIILSNILTAVGGFFLAAKGEVNIPLFFSTVLGLAFVIASACVFNNYIDRGIDAKMKRTKKRALARKIISLRNAIVYATVLGIAGFFLLFFYVNFLTAFIAFIGFFFYVVMYSVWKRRSVFGTLVGSVSGAVPPVVGYCAVTNHFDLAALLLFVILVLWQMPHFYAIALFRYDDYAAASIPVLPIKKGILHTKIQVFFYILFFLLFSSLLTVFHYTGYFYFFVMVTFGVVWLGRAIQGFNVRDEKRWARKMFFFSLVIIVCFSLLLAFNVLLP